MKFFFLVLFLTPGPWPPTPVYCAPEAPLTRSRRVYEALVSGGILKDKVLRWNEKEYDVSADWQICDAYAGICFKAYEAGLSDPLILAVFEIPAGGLDVIAVDYIKYRNDRAQEAIHWFIQRGTSMNDVFKLHDAAGRPVFDAGGTLTRAGEAAYERGLRGGDAGVTKDAKPAEAPKRKRCPHAAAVKEIKKLKLQRYLEINRKEYDCLHSFFPKFEDEELNVKTVCDESRDRYFYSSIDSLDAFVVSTLRHKGKCPEHGTKTFGKP